MGTVKTGFSLEIATFSFWVFHLELKFMLAQTGYPPVNNLKTSTNRINIRMDIL